MVFRIIQCNSSKNKYNNKDQGRKATLCLVVSLFFANLRNFRYLYSLSPTPMGSYVNKHLIKDESVVFETKLHWFTFFTLRLLFTLSLAFWFDRWLSEFVITNRRIIIKTGFIARNTFEMNLLRSNP